MQDLDRILATFGLAALLAGGSATVRAELPVNGFIVKLRAEAGADPASDGKRLLAVTAGQRASLRLGAAVGGDWHQLQSELPLTGDDAKRMAAQLRADPRVALVVPNVREQRMDVTPRDVRYTEQWWLQAPASGNTGVANFTAAWSRSTGVANVAAVAVLDSGITSHPELNPRLLPGYDFVSDAAYANDGDGTDNDPADPGDAITAADRAASPAKFSGCPDAPLSSWHGTIIAGQLAAVTDTADGVAAINWNGRVLPVRVAGKCGAAVADVIAGLRWAAGLAVAGAPLNPNPVRLIVLGYGGVDPCDAQSATPEVAATARLYLDTLDELRRNGANGRGTAVFVAAGNQSRAVGRPASCSGAIAVTALNREGFKAGYANFGAQVAFATAGGDARAGGTGSKCDDQLADGGLVSTSNLGDTTPGAAGYAAASGTSFAAPVAAGLASLMLAVDPTLSVAQLVDVMKRSVRPHILTPQLGSCSLADNPKNPGRCGCTTASCGSGILDADRALALAQNAARVLPALTPTTLSDARFEACAALLGLAPLVTPVTPVTPDPLPPAEPGGSGGGGGGSLSFVWLLLLAAAVPAAARCARRARR